MKNKKVLLFGILGLMLLVGCEKRAADEAQREPGGLLPSYPCITCADGTLYCSDVHKPSC